VKATVNKAKDASTRGLRCCGDAFKVVPSQVVPNPISEGRRYEQEAAVKMRVVTVQCVLKILRRAKRGGRSEGKGRV
jgi:hypothetical protein